MNNKYFIGLNSKFLRLLPLVCIFPILMLILPVLKVADLGVNVSGVELVKEVLSIVGTRGIDIKSCVILTIFLVVQILLLVSGILLLVKPNRSLARFSVVCLVIYTVGMILVMFTAKSIIDASGMLDTGFLIKYLGAGYWCSLALGFVGLCVGLKTIKMSPGYITLTIISVIWVFPIVWIILASFREEGGYYVGYLIPKTFTLDNYKKLFSVTGENNIVQFKKWWLNTFMVASCICVINTLIVLTSSFALSRTRFNGRKRFMSILLIVGMFPGFMSMIAVYNILKGIGLSQTLVALVIVSAAGAIMGYYVCKGYFDTISKSMDEAAIIDGATRWQVFTKVTLPLSKPIVIYTALGSFVGPWGDYIFPSLLMGDNKAKSTVAVGLRWMTDFQRINDYYQQFAAGAVIVSIPIVIIFICMQRFYVEGLSGAVKG